MIQRRQFVAYVLQSGVAVVSASGCGTLLHTERRGQPHSNQIDWKIAALDGLGMILFFVPGVVAFAVDFYTGAIYLPLPQSHPGYAAAPQRPRQSDPTRAHPAKAAPVAGSTFHQVRRPPTSPQPGLKRVAIPREQLGRERIEQIASCHVGQPVSLDDDRTRLSVMRRLDQFSECATRHRSHPGYGVRARRFLKQLRLA